MPTSMLPAMEKLSSQAIFFFSAKWVKTAIARAEKASVTSCRYWPVQMSEPARSWIS